MQLHELQTVTANSLCSSLQVESLDIRYMPGMKEADSLFRSLSLSLAGTMWERDLISSFKSIANCSANSWCCARWGLVPSTCSLGNTNVETVPAFDLQHYRDSHSGSVHCIFWGQVLQPVCPGGCKGWVRCSSGMQQRGRGCSAEGIHNLQTMCLTSPQLRPHSPLTLRQPTPGWFSPEA